MLCFVFAALIVVLDQFFKQWVVRTIDIGGTGPVIIPGLLGLTRWENSGAMLGILADRQWLLAAIAFVAAIVLIMILLRYNEGFWGTLGLASVLGGTVGNLADRIFNDGKVVDMFQTIPFRFPIFNFADIFITLGFVTFLIHFIVITFKTANREKAGQVYADDDEYYDEYDEQEYDEQEYDEQGYNEQGYDDEEYDEFAEIDAAVAAQAEQELHPDTQYSSPGSYEDQELFSEKTQALYEEPVQYEERAHARHDEHAQYKEHTQYDEPVQYGQDSQYPDSEMSSDYEPITDSSFSLDELELELGSLDDYSVEDLLREYGFEDDESL